MIRYLLLLFVRVNYNVLIKLLLKTKKFVFYFVRPNSSYLEINKILGVNLGA